MRLTRTLIATLATAAALLLAGCASSDGNTGGNSTDTPSTTATSGAPQSADEPTTGSSMKGMVMITIKDFAFAGPASVKPGAQVMVMNNDSSTHTVTSDEAGLFDVNVTADGGTATFTAPTRPGSYPYHCTYHSDMHGTLVVK